jgi:hypothetical protein
MAAVDVLEGVMRVHRIFLASVTAIASAMVIRELLWPHHDLVRIPRRELEAAKKRPEVRQFLDDAIERQRQLSRSGQIHS